MRWLFYWKKNMATRISTGNVLQSYIIGQGWKLLTDFINKDEKFGLFNADGTDFYQNIVNYNTSVNFFQQSVVIGGKDINPLTGKLNIPDPSNKNKLLTAAGVISLNYTESSQITNAPIEQGGFISANKVTNPLQAQVVYTITETIKQKNYFQRALSTAKQSLQLFELRTPEFSFSNVNVVSYTIDRNSRKYQMYDIVITVQEVRNKATIKTLSNATAYNGVTTDNGTIQAKEATNLQVQMVGKSQ